MITITQNKKMKTIHKIITLAAAVFIGALAGCESTNKTKPQTPAIVDDVAFSSLRWESGGLVPTVDKGAEFSIVNLKFDGRTLHYEVRIVPSDWGREKAAPEITYPALFVKNETGEWVGGAFVGNFALLEAYDKNNPVGYITMFNGWGAFDGIPPDTEIAFLLIRGDSQRRSNVVVAKTK